MHLSLFLILHGSSVSIPVSHRLHGCVKEGDWGLYAGFVKVLCLKWRTHKPVLELGSGLPGLLITQISFVAFFLPSAIHILVTGLGKPYLCIYRSGGEIILTV